MTLVKFRKPHTSPSLVNLFDDVLGSPWNDVLRGGSAWNSPAVNILETAEAFELEVAAPGLEKKDFAVRVDDGVLTVSARTTDESNGEKTDRDGRYTRREFTATGFERSFDLPETVDADAIDARYENGILRVRLPRREETVARPRTIEIG